MKNLIGVGLFVLVGCAAPYIISTTITILKHPLPHPAANAMKWEVHNNYSDVLSRGISKNAHLADIWSKAKHAGYVGFICKFSISSFAKGEDGSTVQCNGVTANDRMPENAFYNTVNPNTIGDMQVSRFNGVVAGSPPQDHDIEISFRTQGLNESNQNAAPLVKIDSQQLQSDNAFISQFISHSFDVINHLSDSKAEKNEVLKSIGVM